MKKLLLAFALLPIFFSCTKETVTPTNNSNNTTPPPPVDNRTECEKNGTYDLVIINNFKNPYDVYVDGVKLTRVDSKSTYNKTGLKEGNKIVVRAEQVSGYLLLPTIKETTENYLRCTEYTITLQ